MEKIMIINASPRAPKSNSQKYAALFEQYSRVPTQYFNLTKKNHADLCSVMKDFSDLLFVFSSVCGWHSFHFAGVFKITSRISPTTQTRGICLDQLWFYRTGTKRCCSGNGTLVLRRKRISVWFRFKNREWRGNSCNAVSISGTTQNKKISKMRGNTPQTKLTCHDAHYQKNVSSGIYHILGQLRQEKRHYKRANGMYAD